MAAIIDIFFVLSTFFNRLTLFAIIQPIVLFSLVRILIINYTIFRCFVYNLLMYVVHVFKIYDHGIVLKILY